MNITSPAGSTEAVGLKAAEFDVNILLEQMNRYETNYMNSAAEVGEYIRTVNLSNLKIHADLFHMNIDGFYHMIHRTSF